jgi:hypothetical protein
MISNSQISVSNAENYNISFQDNYTIIFTKYLLIISEYLKHYLDNIYIQNPTYYKYIINQGISTLNHVFKFLLIYTKNLDMIYINCQKAYIYYIEFIGQIGNDNHSFLQLNSKDASLFVYKKTIFEINNDIRKDYVSDSIADKLINNIEQLINIYNLILLQLIEKNTLIDVIKIVNTNLNTIMLKIIKISIDHTDNKISAIFTFIQYFKENNLLDYLDIFIKKIKKKNNINLHKLEQNLLKDEIISTIPIKYINSLMIQI